MTDLQKPPAGQDLSQTAVARSLAQDQHAPLVGEIDLGLDGDPDLRTRPGQMALRPRPPRRRIGLVLAPLVALGIAAAWLFGLLESVGMAAPASVSKLLGGSASDAPVAAPAPPEERKPKRKGRR